MKLLSTANPKIQKGTKLGYLSFILHLAPADLSGKEVCPKRTAGCTAACLNTAGRGGMFKKGETTNIIQQARIRKTKMFFEQRAVGSRHQVGHQASSQAGPDSCVSLKRYERFECGKVGHH